MDLYSGGIIFFFVPIDTVSFDYETVDVHSSLTGKMANSWSSCHVKDGAKMAMQDRLNLIYIIGEDFFHDHLTLQCNETRGVCVSWP